MGSLFGKDKTNIPTRKEATTTTAPSQTVVTGTSSTYSVRCTVIGNQGVGKSSLIEQYVNGKFKENIPVTATTQFISKDSIKMGSNAI